MTRRATFALTLALGSISISAAAQQSDVQIYGIAGAGLQVVNPADIDGVRRPSTTGIVSGYDAANRFGLRGTEKISGGLAAIFTLEGGYSIDDGTSSQSRLFGREAAVGLRGAYGTLAAGRFAVLSSGTGNYSLYSQSPFGVSWGDAGMKAAALTSYRVDNGLVYRTPKVGGFTGSAMYSFKVDGGEVAGTANNRRFAGLGGSYEAGNLALSLTGERVIAASTDVQPDETVYTLGASYKLPLVTLYLTYQRDLDAVLKGATVTVGGVARPVAADANLYMLGASVPLAGGRVLASMQWRDGERVQVNGQAFEGDLAIYALAYQYPLSKRTFLYAAQTLSRGAKSYHRSDDGATLSTASARLGLNQTVSTLGLSHRF